MKHLSKLRSTFLGWTTGLVAVGLLSAGCSSSPATPETQEDAQEAAVSEEAKAQQKAPDYGIFKLKAEPEVACAQVDVVDVNLGNSPESFVRAAHCQIAGKPAPDDVVKKWSEGLRTKKYVRRVDVVRQLCEANGRKCDVKYTDPWESQPELGAAPERKVKREIGAVLMFFFDCPGKVNCNMNWANTHSPGMDTPVESLGFKDKKTGFYKADNPGFWRRELLDAQYAGLSFLMPNAYGPDMEDGKLKPLQEALDSIENPIQVALMDDTWTWGEPWFSDFWKQRPNLKDTEAAAKLLYESKWKRFYSQIDKKHWYRFKGKPFIYFYNAGKLDPKNHASEVIARMKQMFKADFGEEPFVVVDVAFFMDQRMDKVADSQFKWFTFQSAGNRTRSTLNGHIIDHTMVRWDAVGREHFEKNPHKIATARDLMFKDGAILERVLDESKDAELLVLATWNDLGEGTGVNRNYDYYVGGHWLPPDYFMRLIRQSQSGN